MLPPKEPRKKLWIAAGVLVVAGLLAYIYRDAFRPQEILITHRVVVGPPIRGLSRTNQDLKIPQVAFGLDRKYKLTEIKVISLTALETGTKMVPLWHVISDSNSVPVKAFAYGAHIRGLRPLVKNACALPLEPNINYRLQVWAGRQAGQHDFSVGQVITVNR
jgi:hypothetical protein